jgi:hypothetical protein
LEAFKLANQDENGEYKSKVVEEIFGKALILLDENC